LYEVNLQIETSHYPNYLAWLKEHIAQMCQIPGFLGATLLQPEFDTNCYPSKRFLVVHYQVESMQALQDYFENFAQKMRQEGISRFGDLFSASRRILTLLKDEP